MDFSLNRSFVLIPLIQYIAPYYIPKYQKENPCNLIRCKVASSQAMFFFFQFKIFYSKYALLHTLQLLDAQFNVTNSTYKHTL